MPPKVKITKDNIVETAIELIRKGGEVSLNARNIANDITHIPIKVMGIY